MRKLIVTLSMLPSAICLACTIYLKYNPEYYMEEWVLNYMIFMFSLTSFIFLYSAATEFKLFNRWNRWTKNIRGWNPQYSLCLTTIPTLMYHNQLHDKDGFYYRQHSIIVVLPLVGFIDMNWKYDLVRPTVKCTWCDGRGYTLDHASCFNCEMKGTVKS